MTRSQFSAKRDWCEPLTKVGIQQAEFFVALFLCRPRNLQTLCKCIESLELAFVKERRIACSPHIHQAQATNATGARTQIIRTKQATNAAMSSGAMQYPRTQRPWKKDLYARHIGSSVCTQQGKSPDKTRTYTLPPRSLAWTVTTREPTETITTTFVNTEREWAAGAYGCRVFSWTIMRL